MTDYIIIKNREQVLLGPMPWRQRMFQSEINDLYDDGELSEKFEVPVLEAYYSIGDGFEILPVRMELFNFNHLFEELAGPFWTFEGNIAVGSYVVSDGPLTAVKAALKNILATLRYNKEQAPFKYTIQGQEISIDASRENRNIFVQKYQFMGDIDTVDWKFPEGWLTLTKAELGELVAAGASHIQTQFNWEKNYTDQIDAATTIDQLKSIHNEFDPPEDPFGVL